MGSEAIQTVITLENIRPQFDLEALAERAGIGDDARKHDRLASLAREAAEHASLDGAALVAAVEFGPGEEDTDLGGVIFTSPLLREKLSGLGRVFPYLATEGPELAQWGASHKGGEGGPLVHAIRQQAVKYCERELEQRLGDMFGIPTLSAMNPGSLKEWPIIQQPRLLELFGALPKKFGVSLLPSNIMQPDYTVSGIFFQTDKKYYNCQLCPRDNCPNRKAPREK